MNSLNGVPVGVPRRDDLDITRLAISVAGGKERDTIYRLRHEVYACELGQHRANAERRLRDSLDSGNIYLVAKSGEDVVGFISITPPGSGYSVDKYVARGSLPFSLDSHLYEVRLLTVCRGQRRSETAYLLMYAALRWVESHGGGAIMAMGRREILGMYQRVGLVPTGIAIAAGKVTYDLLHATVTSLREHVRHFRALTDRLERKTEWKLGFPFRKPASCFHGGDFFKAIGERFDHLERRFAVINADVLDAWFPPSPKVLSALQADLPWLLRTSPPTSCSGLQGAIAEARGVAPRNILPGAGSSDLIFRALRAWLTPRSSVLILDPTYGEYAHVLEQVIGCEVHRLQLSPHDGYAVDINRVRAALQEGYDLVILVNPNSPTGGHIPRSDLEEVLRSVPAQTRVWIDETYVEYAAPGESLERFAAQSEQVIVCKSMSKVYALSGARVAYLCAGAHQLEALRAITPPWVVSLPAQVAAVEALRDRGYYEERYRETHKLRATLVGELLVLGFGVIPGIANFVLCRLPTDGPDAEALVTECKRQQLFLRNASAMGTQVGDRAIRIAVKDATTNARMVEIIRQALLRLSEGVPPRLAGCA